MGSEMCIRDSGGADQWRCCVCRARLWLWIWSSRVCTRLRLWIRSRRVRRPWLRLRIRNSRVRRTRLRLLWIRTRRVRDDRVRLRIWIETVRGPEVPLWIRIGCAKPALLRWTAIRLCGWAPAATAHGGALSDRSRAPPLSQSQSMLGAARSQVGRFFNHSLLVIATGSTSTGIAAQRAPATGLRCKW